MTRHAYPALGSRVHCSGIPRPVLFPRNCTTVARGAAPAGHSIQALTGEPSKPWKVRSSTWSVHSGVDSGRRSSPLAAPCCARVRAQKASVSAAVGAALLPRSEEHTSELQSRFDLVCRLLLEKKNNAETHGSTRTHKL